jgi:hypothetical protein
MTNADRIRAMTDEKLAHFWETRPVSCPPMETLCSGKNCYDCWLDWLKQEVPAPPQKDPLCLSCNHGENGCVDDFATCYCPHYGYVGQKTECGEYEAKEVSDNGKVLRDDQVPGGG